MCHYDRLDSDGVLPLIICYWATRFRPAQLAKPNQPMGIKTGLSVTIRGSYGDFETNREMAGYRTGKENVEG